MVHSALDCFEIQNRLHARFTKQWGKKRTKRLHFFFITHSTLVLIGLTWCLSVNKTFSVLVAAALAFLAAVVFGSEIEKYSSVSLNWGFAFDIIGGIFLCGAATAFFVEYMRHRWVRSCLFEVSTGAIPRGRQGSGYGMVPKGLLTFLGSLYKEVMKTTSRTLGYCFERQTARKNFFLPKTLCPT